MKKQLKINLEDHKHRYEEREFYFQDESGEYAFHETICVTCGKDVDTIKILNN